MTNESTRWVRASELAQLLHLSPGRISQLVAAGILRPIRRNGRTVFDADRAIADYQANIAPRVSTMEAREQLRRLAAGPLTTAELLELNSNDDGPEDEAPAPFDYDAIDFDAHIPAPLLPHGLAAVARAGGSAFWWQCLLEDPGDTPAGTAQRLVDDLLAGPQGEQVRQLLARCVDAAASTAWAAMADGLAYGAPALPWMAEELWPTLQAVPLLQEQARREGVDPARGPEQWPDIPAPWQREATA